MATVTVIQPITATETNKLRVAAYCRVSGGSEDQLNSYQAQMTYYSHKFEDSTTEELVDLYADEGITGTRDDKRDEFQRLMKDCRRGKIDRIYTKSISRFARNTKDCLKNLRELKALGITVIFEKENIDTANMTDEIMITILGGLAQEESVSISQNIRWGIEKKMKNGTFIQPTAPYGYQMKNQTLVICEEEAKIVRFIFSAYLAGYGIRSIQEMLNASEDTKLNHSEWKYDSIRYILSNEKYTGNSLWHKFCMTDTLPYRKIVNRGHKPQYYSSETHPAIISEEEFEKVKLLMKMKRSEKTELDSPFKRKLFCKECGSMFRIKHIRGKTYWICRTHDLKAELCSMSQIAEKQIIAAFITMHNKLLHHYKELFLPMQIALQELKIRKFSGSIRVMDIHKEIAKFREQVHVLSRLKTKGFLDESKYQEQTTELNAKINRLHQELKRMTHSDEEDETLDQIEMLVEIFEKREQLMTAFEPDIFESIVDRIVVKSRNELEFHLIGGLKLTEKI